MKRFSFIQETSSLFVFGTGLSLLIGITAFLVIRYEELIRVLSYGG